MGRIRIRNKIYLRKSVGDAGRHGSGAPGGEIFHYCPYAIGSIVNRHPHSITGIHLESSSGNHGELRIDVRIQGVSGRLRDSGGSQEGEVDGLKTNAIPAIGVIRSIGEILEVEAVNGESCAPQCRVRTSVQPSRGIELELHHRCSGMMSNKMARIGVRILKNIGVGVRVADMSEVG